jgi:RNA polymerase sigma-70 factor (ECF subfamily)
MREYSRFSFDAEYVRRLIDRDRHVEQHFTSYFGDLLRIKIGARLRSRDLMEDVRQETFARVFKALHANALEHPERLGAFVNSVCNNVLMETVRGESRAVPLPDDSHQLRDMKADTERDLVKREAKALIAQALDEMPPKDRELLKQLFLEEGDKDRICTEFGVNREYLRVLIHRAKLRLRAALEAKEV